MFDKLKFWKKEEIAPDVPVTDPFAGQTDAFTSPQPDPFASQQFTAINQNQPPTQQPEPLHRDELIISKLDLIRSEVENVQHRLTIIESRLRDKGW